MPKTDHTRPRIGDVVEIPVGSSLAYAHYTHKHPQFGALLRVFGELHAGRPTEFVRLVQKPAQFTCFFPLGAACSRGIVKIVATEEIAQPKAFPTFRTGVADSEGKIKCWWLWDGASERKVGKLAPEMVKFPIRGVINDTLLTERILSGWCHEKVT